MKATYTVQYLNVGGDGLPKWFDALVTTRFHAASKREAALVKSGRTARMLCALGDVQLDVDRMKGSSR